MSNKQVYQACEPPIHMYVCEGRTRVLFWWRDVERAGIDVG